VLVVLVVLSPRVAALRRHAAGVAVAPQRRGALLTLGARF
jgi:hypothetical protein